jgi:hypothetical protein
MGPACGADPACGTECCEHSEPHDLHLAAEPRELPLQLPKALQIDVETLEQVHISAPLGSAAGCSGTTCEHVIAELRTSDRSMALSVQFINLILGGALPRCASLLDGCLIALSKPCLDGQPEGIRPIAVGEVWLRLASLCAVAKV